MLHFQAALKAFKKDLADNPELAKKYNVKVKEPGKILSCLHGCNFLSLSVSIIFSSIISSPEPKAHR